MFPVLTIAVVAATRSIVSAGASASISASSIVLLAGTLSRPMTRFSTVMAVPRLLLLSAAQDAVDLFVHLGLNQRIELSCRHWLVVVNKAKIQRGETVLIAGGHALFEY